MAIKSNNRNSHLEELRSWWEECREQIASEHFSQYRTRGKVGVDLIDYERGEGVKESLSLELHEGIPLLVVRDPGTKDMKAVIGDAMGTYTPKVSSLAGSPVDGVLDPAVETVLLEEIQDNYSELLSRLGNAVAEDEKKMFAKLGRDRKQMIVDAVCGNVILDESIVTPAHLYYHTRGMSAAELDKLRIDARASSEILLKELADDGTISRKDFREMVSYTRKGISDMFHPWTLLRGRLDSQVRNLSLMKGECTPDIIAKVVSWAEKMPSYAAYVGKELEEWVKGESKHYRVKISDVTAERAKIAGVVKQSTKGRPELSAKVHQRVREKFFKINR